ncbi:hypothetical protein R9C00_02740 [Flammeovirgaceae bacterium SG7u.111]|nr:hypothetical protein [Flammeovirgaceae bacterium SG7u.132]WPO36357.1 hypothetical protein R9C00_02740 [Flammeovirgaceae bacterium SG7u.111]
MKDLQNIWEELAAKYCDDVLLVEKLWREIEVNYSSEKRDYHNLSHLVYMFGKALGFEKEIEDFDILAFSIFYHDIIYKNSKKNNEGKSAEFAKNRLELLGIPPEKIAACQAQIIATKAHETSQDSDTNWLLNFDLGILGEDTVAYQAYTQNIRKEYAIYPDFLYKKGRAKVVKHFLEMEHIFKTTPFQNKYDQQARKNLETELKALI